MPKWPVILVVLLFLSSCRQGGERTDALQTKSRPSAGPNIVTFAATEYAFHGPEQIPAGLTTIRQQNRGKEIHWMEIFRLAPRKTVADFLAAITASESEFQPPHSWTTAMGGPGWIGPGETSNVTAYFEPGDYVLICRFPTMDGVSHLKKGMVHELKVGAAARSPTAAELQADIAITVSDTAFTLQVPISAGTHTVRVMNAGSYRHELYIFQLAPGKSIEDYWTWEREGLTGSGRPGRPWGGVAPFEPGTHVWFKTTFDAGEYVFGDESGDGSNVFRQITVR
ncbi:MAG: hypothetical protein O6826_03875 [Acidobacteria bacterium]|nr:hypothetical protein [Acidobacteriota bacterium]